MDEILQSNCILVGEFLIFMGVISMFTDRCRAIADSVKSWWLS